MNLPRSTYYQKPKSKTGNDRELIERIVAIIEEFPGYGYRRVTHELHHRDVAVNHKRVLRRMRQQGLIRKPKRRWIRTTNSDHHCRIYPNLLKNLAVTGPNQVWVADITYIALQTAFVYLAVILDLFARKAVGYTLSHFIDTALCLKALGMAIRTRKPLNGIIHHSDQGVQYASRGYVGTLLAYGFQISIAKRGNPYDNAVAESFMKTLKTGEVYLWEYRTIIDVQNRFHLFHRRSLQSQTAALRSRISAAHGI